MKVLRTALFILVAMSIHDKSQAFQNNTNYDEAKIPAYQLPELLTCNNGTRVETKADWTDKRRGEILQLFKEHVYGAMPAAQRREEFYAAMLPSVFLSFCRSAVFGFLTSGGTVGFLFFLVRAGLYLAFLDFFRW